MGKKTKTKLKPGEVRCPKCNGSGKLKSWMSGEFEITPECGHCWGEGKLDWIERVMGKPTDRFGNIYDLSQEVVDYMAQEIANRMDKEILESITKEVEQNKKGKEDKNDNRVFSELLLHTTAEQKLEGKKD